MDVVSKKYLDRALANVKISNNKIIRQNKCLLNRLSLAVYNQRYYRSHRGRRALKFRAIYLNSIRNSYRLNNRLNNLLANVRFRSIDKGKKRLYVLKLTHNDINKLKAYLRRNYE